MWKRKPNTNKGDYGKVLVIAGSAGMLGAGVLATRAALRSGAGLVYWAVPKELKNLANLATPEVIVVSHDEIKNIKPDVAAIGPGVGKAAQKLLLTTYHLQLTTLIIDADALEVWERMDAKKKAKAKVIITPHPGELSRLTGLSIKTIQNDRLGVAKEYARRWNVRLVLKGHKTVVAYPDGRTYINNTGNPGMATAGAGDVLTGMIAAFKAQALCVCEAVKAHGLAGDLAKKEKGELGLIASDIIDRIPYAIQKFH